MAGLTDFEQQSQLGHGPLGPLWRARRLFDGTPAVVRILDPSLAYSWGSLDLQTTNLARSLYPNLARIYGHGQDPAGIWLASEYLEGMSLRALLASRGPVPLAQACTIVNGVLGGLAAAHQAGVLHRDVAPENIFLGPAGAPKLTDVGLTAMRAPGAAGWRPQEGRPLYVSPEQIRGEPLDFSTDVYSAAAVLYELVTGRPAFAPGPSGPGGQQLSPDDAILSAHVAGLLPSVDGLPAAVGHLILRALSPSPERRPRHAYAFAQELTQAASACLAPGWYDEGAAAAMAFGRPGGSVTEAGFTAPGMAPEAPALTYAAPVQLPVLSGWGPAAPSGSAPAAPAVPAVPEAPEAPEAPPSPSSPGWWSRRTGLKISSLVAVLLLLIAVPVVVVATRSSSNRSASPTPTPTPSPGRVAAGGPLQFVSHTLIDDGTTLNNVSCTSPTFCMALDAGSSNTKTWTWNGSVWSAATVATPQSLLELSGTTLACGSSTFCAILGTLSSSASSSTNTYLAATWNGSTWSTPTTLTDPGNIGTGLDLSCPTATFCLGTDGGVSWTYQNGAWSKPIAAPGNGATANQSYGPLSCVSLTFCLSVSLDTLTWNGTQWTNRDISTPQGLMTSLDCPTASFCVALEDPSGGSNGATSAAVTWNGHSWSAPVIVANHASSSTQLVDLSCPSATNCVALGESGSVYQYLGGRWSSAIDADSGSYANTSSISCPSVSFCAFTDTSGNVFTSKT